MTETLTEYVCTVHYDDDGTDEVSIFATDAMATAPKGVTRAARDKARHVGERFTEGGHASERPQPTWAEIKEEREVEVSR